MSEDIVPNENTGLMSQEDIARVRKVWELFMQSEPIEHCVEILIRMFEQHPEVRSRFQRFRADNPRLLRNSWLFMAHACRVIGSLGSIVSMLEDEELLRATAFLLADSHLRHQVTVADFQIFREVTISYLAEAFGEKLNEESARAFDLFLATLVEQLSQTISMTAIYPSSLDIASGTANHSSDTSAGCGYGVPTFCWMWNQLCRIKHKFWG